MTRLRFKLDNKPLHAVAEPHSEQLQSSGPSESGMYSRDPIM